METHRERPESARGAFALPTINRIDHQRLCEQFLELHGYQLQELLTPQLDSAMGTGDVRRFSRINGRGAV